MSSRPTRSSARLSALSAARSQHLRSSNLPDRPRSRSPSGRKRKAEPPRDVSPVSSSSTTPILKRRKQSQRPMDSIENNPTRPPPASKPTPSSRSRPSRPAAPTTSKNAKTAAKSTSSSTVKKTVDLPRASKAMPHRANHRLSRHNDPEPLNSIPVNAASAGSPRKNKANSAAEAPPPPPLGINFPDTRMLDFSEGLDESGIDSDDAENADDPLNHEMADYSPEEDEDLDEDEDDEEAALQSGIDIDKHPNYGEHDEHNLGALLHEDGDPDDQDDDDLDDLERNYSDMYGNPFGHPAEFLPHLLGGSSNGQIGQLVATMRKAPTVKVDMLDDIASRLLLSSGINLSDLSWAPELAKILVEVLFNPDFEDNPNLMFSACNCMFNMVEAMPQTATSLVNKGAVAVLCRILGQNLYMDIPELVLKTLRAISKNHPEEIVLEGGLAIILPVIDFFETAVQRIAITMAANCCHHLPREAFPKILDIIPNLQNIMAGCDPKIVEQACICVSEIANSFSAIPGRIEELITQPLLKQIVRLVSPLTTSFVGQHIQTKLLRVLAITAHCSPQRSVELLQLDVVDVLCHIVTGLPLNVIEGGLIPKIDSSSIMQTLVRLPLSHIHSVLSVIYEIFPIPILPSTIFTDSSEVSNPDFSILFVGSLARSQSNSRRISLLEEVPDDVSLASRALLAILSEIYSNTVNVTVRKQVLSICVKIFSYLPVGCLQDSIDNSPYASFLANILSQQEHSVLMGLTLRSAELLISRPGLNYQASLIRGGMLSEILKVSERQTPSLPNRFQALSSVLETTSHNSSTDPSGDEDDEKDPETRNPSCLSPIPHGIEEEESGEDEGDYSDEVDGYGYENHLASEDEDDDPEADSEDEISNSSSSDKTDWIPRYNDGSHNLGPDTLVLREFITAKAKKFMETHALGENKEAGYHVSLAQQLSLKIEKYVRTGQGNGADYFFKLTEFFDDSSDSELTSYELLSSSVVSTLNRIFSSSSAVVDPRPLFLRAFLRHSSTGPTFFSNLVVKLEELLSRVENFEVLTVGHTSPNVAIAKQLQLDLRPSDPNTASPTLSSLSVSIQAISNFKALNDYLVDRALVDGLLYGLPSASGSPSGIPHHLFGGDDASEMLQSILTGSLGRGLGRDSRQSKKTGSQSKTETPTADEDETLAETERGLATSTAEASRQTSSSVPSQTTPLSKFKSSPNSHSKLATTPSAPSSSARRQTQASQSPEIHFEFWYKGKRLKHEDTVFGIILSSYQKTGKELDRMWTSRHSVEYKQVDGKAPALPNIETTVHHLPVNDVRESLQADPETFVLLQLLNVLHTFSETATTFLVRDESSDQLSILENLESRFMNTKLTAKLSRQLEEYLVVASHSIPLWALGLARFYPFLFPLSTRQMFIQSTSFGYFRLLALWQKGRSSSSQNGSGAGSRYHIGLADKQKVRVSRKRMLESAVKVMELYGAISRVLEIEYFDEIGTGLGPTLEFYTVVSRDFSRIDLKMWRDGDSSFKSSHVSCKTGLFPSPMSKEQSESVNGKRILHLFSILGKFIARSIIDSRIIDFFFNAAFFRHVNSGTPELSIGSVALVDPEVAQSLKFMMKFVLAKEQAPTDPIFLEGITVDGSYLQDLSLDFTLPGDISFELIPDGSNIPVTIHNVEKYIERVIDATVGAGISKQVEAFCEGFSGVFPHSSLQTFTPTELVAMFGQGEEDWSYNTLLGTIKSDHGYNTESRTFQNLLAAMSQFTNAERRQFLQFSTGSSRLPIGGFKGLVPMFTVVRKPGEPPLMSDDFLPSVMTCANYLKLPDYSTLEILKEKIGVAMREGRGSFLLS